MKVFSKLALAVFIPSLLLGLTACGSSDNDTAESVAPKSPLTGGYIDHDNMTDDGDYQFVMIYSQNDILNIHYTSDDERYYIGYMESHPQGHTISETIRLVHKGRGADESVLANITIEHLNSSAAERSAYTLTIAEKDTVLQGVIQTEPEGNGDVIDINFLKQEFMPSWAPEWAGSNTSYQWLGDNRISFTSQHGCEIEASVNKTGLKSIITDEGWASSAFDFLIDSSTCEIDEYANAGMIFVVSGTYFGKEQQHLTIYSTDSLFYNQFYGQKQ